MDTHKHSEIDLELTLNNIKEKTGGKVFLDAKDLCAIFGFKLTGTVRNLLRDDGDSNFPRPKKVRGRNLWTPYQIAIFMTSDKQE